MTTSQPKIPYKRLTYKKNTANGSIAAPEVYLCNRNLTKIGRLYPVENPNLIVNYNAADEISFSYYKEVDGIPCAFYNKLQDLSVIKMEAGNHDDRYFEVSVTETDNGSLTKNVSGKSLGFSELSQKLVSLEVNTENDFGKSVYSGPTVLYDENNPKRSLLHRLLTYAPDYEIGEVGETIAPLQRTFSWSNSYMDSCLNDICQELECIYTIDVFLDRDTLKPVRRINFYDICYCIDCWNQLNTMAEPEKRAHRTRGFWKNISNGQCMECGNTNIAECGEDTTITVNTKNLTDEIQVTSDKDQIKNCFSLKAGDDYMTNTIQAINPSASNKIIMFSNEQLEQMSPVLQEKWNAYLQLSTDPKLIAKYESLIELNFNILDLILYAESGKMPVLDTETGTIDDQYNDIFEGLRSYQNKFYTSSSASLQKATSARTAITSLISTFLRKGYSLLVNATDSVSGNMEDNSCYYWYGSYKVYKTEDKDTCFEVTVTEDGIRATRYYGKDGKQITNNYSGMYKIVYGDRDIKNYKIYLEQQLNAILTENGINQYQITDWKSCCINRLDSFSTAYRSCIDMLDIMSTSVSSFQEERDKQINQLRTNYSAYIEDIITIKNVLEDERFALYYILGDIEQLKENYPPINSTQNYYYKLKAFSNLNKAVYSLSTGTKVQLHTYDSTGKPESTQKIYVGLSQHGDRAVQCLNCGSTHMLYDSASQLWCCSNKLCADAQGTAVVTYSQYAVAVCNWYKENSSKTITKEIDTIHHSLDIENFMGADLFRELSTFLREDIYENNNYISENLASNTELITNAREFTQQAKRELAKACMPQISISCDIANLIVQDDIKPQNLSIENAYEKFAPGNFIRVIADNTVYRLRVISVTYPFSTLDKIQVTFSNITRTLTGSAGDVKSILSQVSSIATSFQTVAAQAQKGEVAARKFDYLKKEGLDSSLGAVKAANCQSILIDDNGLTCRHFNRQFNEYDDRQLKIINSNIVITEDNWKTSKLAIGLGMYQGKPNYGVWADTLMGDLIVGEKLLIRNDASSVSINDTGISIKNDDTTEKVFVVDTSGNGFFKGEVVATSGKFSGNITSSNFYGGSINIGDGNFTVDYNGAMTAKNGTFEGSINASENSNFGSWYVNEYAGIHRKNFSYNDVKYSFTINGANIEMRDNVGCEGWTDGINDGNYRMRFRVNVSEGIAQGIYYLGNKVEFNLSDAFYCRGNSYFYKNTYFYENAEFSSSALFNNISIKAPDGVPLDGLRVLNYTDNTIRTVLGNMNTVLFLDAPVIWTSNPITVTSDERLKKEFSSLTSYENFFMDLEPCSYKYIDGTSSRKHIGFKAQQIKKSLEKNNLTTQDFAAYVNSSNDENGELSLRYTEFIALNTHMIQQLYKRIERLESVTNGGN